MTLGTGVSSSLRYERHSNAFKSFWEGRCCNSLFSWPSWLNHRVENMFEVIEQMNKINNIINHSFGKVDVLYMCVCVWGGGGIVGYGTKHRHTQRIDITNKILGITVTTYYIPVWARFVSPDIIIMWYLCGQMYENYISSFCYLATWKIFDNSPFLWNTMLHEWQLIQSVKYIVLAYEETLPRI